MSRIQPWRVLLLLTLFSLLLTWPLLPHLLTHVPGDGIDDPALAWNLWWARDSWVDRAGQDGGLVHNVFDGDGMFYPAGINLAFYTLTVLNGALSIPLQLAGSVILASNLLLLSSFVIGGFGAYLLALEVAGGRWQVAGGKSPSGTRSPSPVTPHLRLVTSDLRLAAFLAALLYAFASSKLFYAALGQFNVASSQWLPFVALYLVRSLRPPWRWRNGAMLGLFLVLQTWSELTFGTFAVLLVVLVALLVGGWHVVTRLKVEGLRFSLQRATCNVQRATFNLFLAVLLFVLGMLPFLAAMLPDLRAEGDFLVEGRGFADIFSADLAGFFFPTQLHPIFGSIIRAISADSALRPDGAQFQVNKGQHLYFGYVALALAVVGLWVHRRQLWVWLVAGLTLFFTLVALGPSLRVNGSDTGIPGPFLLLLRIPLFQANRYPSRYSVLILLGLSILVALGAAALLQRLRPERRTLTAVLLAGLLLFEHLSVPLPLSDFRLPPAYNAVVTDPRPGALLDLPVGWRNGFNVFGKSDVVIMFEQWYQTFHGRPLLGGNTSRNPESKFQYFLEHPVIGVLAALQDGRPVPPDDLRRAQVLAPDLLRFLNVHAVLVHRDKVPSDFEATLVQLFPLDLVDTQDGIARYEARWPDERQTVSLTPADAELASYLAQGWGAAVQWGVRDQYANPVVRWATRDRVGLIPPAASRPAELHLALYSPAAQTVTLLRDGQEAGAYDLETGVNHLTLPLPPSSDGFPRHLELRASRTFDPASIATGSRAIGSTGVTSPVHITVRSAGKDIGDFGHIYVNGVDLSPNRRGYNLVALAPDTGALISADAFDTHDPRTPGESARLAAWVADLPPGTIVAGAVRDAAALNLSEDALAAFWSLGVVNDIRGQLRRAHGFIGVKDAPAGSAMDFVSDLWPVTVSVGDGLTEPAPSFALMGLGWQVGR